MFVRLACSHYAKFCLISQKICQREAISSANDFFAPTKTFSSVTKLQRFRRLALEAVKIVKRESPFFLDIHPSKRRWNGLLNWIKTSKIHNRRILATKTITNCLFSKSRFCMKSKRQKSAIKTFRGSIFHSQISTGNLARKQTLTDMSRHLDGKLIKLLIYVCH